MMGKLLIEWVYLQALYDDSIWKYIRYEFYRPLKAVWVHDEKNASCTTTCGGGNLFALLILTKHNLLACYIAIKPSYDQE